jgi:sigma-E factor negative regulatory protein RseC
MPTEHGRVVALEPQGVWVETVRSSACGRCAAKAGCGHGVLAQVLARGKGLIRARAGQVALESLTLGDVVEIQLPESVLTGGALAVYGLPLVVGLCLSWLGSHQSELMAITGFAGGLLAGFLLVRLALRHWYFSTSLEPTVEDIVESSGGIIATSP